MKQEVAQQLFLYPLTGLSIAGFDEKPEGARHGSRASSVSTRKYCQMS